jgi:uncharacterized protein with FMN-binding domain
MIKEEFLMKNLSRRSFLKGAAGILATTAITGVGAAIAEERGTYIPGTYSTSLILNDMTANIEVIVDENYISSVRFVELNEALKTKYPLLEPALSDIADQLIETQSMESIVYSDDMRYTATLLISAIESALKEATNIPNE